MKNSQKYVQRQEQKVSSSMIQGLNMLTVPSYAMYDHLVELAVENPMLEIPEAPAGEVFESVGRDEELAPARFETGRDPGYYSGEDAAFSASEDEEFDPYYAAGEGFYSDGLMGSLELQLSMCRPSRLEELVGLDILGSLDENGYFAGNLNSICLLYCCDISVGEKMLRTIQGFSPRGIAARDVYEALCLQVEDGFEHAELARSVIRDDLQMMSQGLCSRCAKKYKVSEQCMRRVFDYIKTLEPRPGNCDEGRFRVGYVSPDIVVRNNGGELAVYVSGDGGNPLRLNEDYLELMKHASLSAQEKQYLRSCLNAARSLIRSVDIRRQTLHKAALSLVTLQSDFFLRGPEHLSPLSMQQMAESMGVSISTVSRVAQDKYVCCPWGAFPIKHFFSRTVKGTDDGPMSAAGANKLIEQIISREDPSEPVTDEQISALLKENGYDISRRTVSKYRLAAGIPGCAQRKRRVI